MSKKFQPYPGSDSDIVPEVLLTAYLKLLTRLLDFLHNPKKVYSYNGRFCVTPEGKKK